MVATCKAVQVKQTDPDNICVFVGYLKVHTKDVFRFYNLSTKKIIQSKGVMWLGKLYGDYVKKALDSSLDNREDNDEEIEAVEDAKAKAIGLKGNKMRWVLFNLDTSYNSVLSREKTYFGVQDIALASVEAQEDL